MGWKIYSWVMGIFWISAILYTIFSEMPLFVDVVDFIVIIISVLGLFCYSYKKRILNALFWKVFFFVSVLWLIASLSIIEVYIRGEIFSKGMFAFFIVFFLPIFCGLYLYAFSFFDVFCFSRKPARVNPKSQLSYFHVQHISEEEKLRNMLKKTWYVLGIVVAISLTLFFAAFAVKTTIQIIAALSQSGK